MPTEFPSIMNICGHYVGVIFDDDLKSPARVDFEKEHIYLSQKYSEDIMLSALWKGVIEFTARYMGVSLRKSISTEGFSRISFCLYQIMRDNDFNFYRD